MAALSDPATFPTPTILPLGDSGVLVRFGTTLSDAANRAAIALVRAIDNEPIPGVVAIVPNLVSVLLRYDPMATGSYASIAGELRLRLHRLPDVTSTATRWSIPVTFD